MWVGAERPPTTKKIWFYFVAIPKHTGPLSCGALLRPSTKQTVSNASEYRYIANYAVTSKPGTTMGSMPFAKGNDKSRQIKGAIARWGR